MANRSNGGGSAAFSGSNAERRAVGVLPEKFPEGLRLLIVDDDRTCLMVLEKKLLQFKYEVTKCNRAEIALSLLRKNKNSFDIVLTDVRMPDMDGFKLLERVGLEMDLPVIMMSADDSRNVVMKGVIHGACDYLIKPVREDALRTIWKHVVRKKAENGLKELEQPGSPEENHGFCSSANESNSRNPNFKRKNNEEGESDEREDNNASTSKKARVVWSADLHRQFVAVVNHLGPDKAVPKKILEIMNVPWLTRENVASHLQKYRLCLRRLSEMSQQGDNLNWPFPGPHDTNFHSIPSLGGNGSAVPSATFLRAGLGSPVINPIMNLSFGGGQSQHLRSSSSQMNLLLDISMKGMEPKQPAIMNVQRATSQMVPVDQSSSRMMQMSQPQRMGNHIISQLQAPVAQQPVLSNGLSGKDLVQGLTTSLPNVPLNHIASELSGNSFPSGSTTGISIATCNAANGCDVKIPGGFTPSYDIFEDLNKSKPQEWELQDTGLPGIQEPVSFFQGLFCTGMDGHARSALVLPGEGSENRNMDNSGQHFNPIYLEEGSWNEKSDDIGRRFDLLCSENSARLKPENVELDNQDLVGTFL